MIMLIGSSYFTCLRGVAWGEIALMDQMVHINSEIIGVGEW